MAPPQLSSNWKKLQAKIKAESSHTTSTKRKADEPPAEENSGHPEKKARKSTSQRPSTKKPEQPTRAVRGPTKTHAGALMGAAQSSKVDSTVPKLGVSPSLALWAEDNDVSPEDIAEAYGLGTRDTSLLNASAVRPNEGLAEGADVGKYIAIDCEMVGVGDGGYESSLARVSVVDFHGRQVYDSFVRQKEKVTDWRTHVSGVSAKHMVTAREFEEVQERTAALLKGRILVGHDVKHDLQVLRLDHPQRLTRDTAKFSGFKKYGHGPKPSLRKLAQELLGVEIHTGQHSSIEDARVAMLLFRRHKQAFDVEIANRFPDAQPTKSKPQPKKSKKKRKH